MPRLVELHVTGAGHQEVDRQPEAVVPDVPRELHALGPELGHRGLDVVAHQRDLVVLPPPAGGVDAQFAGTRPEDEPAAARVDVGPAQDVTEEGPGLIGIVGVSLAQRPPDANHPYGHRKYETVAALGVAGMLFLGCREIAGAAIARLHTPRPPDITVAAWAVMLGTLAVNLLVVRIERREGQRLAASC